MKAIMIERVATAISGAPFATKASIVKARAALQAIRDLPPEIFRVDFLSVGFQALPDGSEDNRYADPDDIKEIWEAMIDAILKGAV